jgi:hypothetical protein
MNHLSSSIFHLQDEDENEIISEISTPSPVKKIDANIQFREYRREGSLFVATDDYYGLGDSEMVFEKLNGGKIYFCPKVGSYYEMKRNGEYDVKEYLDLYVIHDIVLDEATEKISKQELILKMSLNQVEFEDKFIRDLYLDTYHFVYQAKEEDSLFMKEHLRMEKRYIFAVQSTQFPNPQQISI